MAKAAIAVGLMGIMTAAQVYSQQQAGKQNEKIQRLNADMARNSAELQAQQIRDDGARRLAAIQADAAASGFTQEGTILDTLFSQARETEREARIALYNGQVQSTANLAQAQKIKSDTKSQTFNTLSSFGMKAYSAGSSGLTS